VRGGFHDLRRRPRLAQRHRQIAAEVHVRTVPGVHAGRGEPGRASRRHLQQVAAVDGHVVRRPAGEEHGPGQPAGLQAPGQDAAYLIAVGGVPGDEPAEDFGLLAEFGGHE
jgi:hypothetical protein